MAINTVLRIRMDKYMLVLGRRWEEDDEDEAEDNMDWAESAVGSGELRLAHDAPLVVIGFRSLRLSVWLFMEDVDTAVQPGRTKLGE